MDGAPIDDRGLLLGDGLFETLLALDGRLVFLEAHLARLGRGCEVLGLPPPHEAAFRAAARDALQRAGLTQARAAVRVTWTAGSGGRGLDRPASPIPRLFAAAFPAAADPAPISLAIAQTRRNQDSPVSRLKTLSYLDNVLARREATAQGADEGLMLNGRGELACAAAANLFWVREERLCTPALDCGVLDGVARGQVIGLARAHGVPIQEARVGLGALSAAEAIFLTNSLMGVRAVGRLEQRDLPPHPLVARLAEALDATMRAA